MQGEERGDVKLFDHSFADEIVAGSGIHQGGWQIPQHVLRLEAIQPVVDDYHLNR